MMLMERKIMQVGDKRGEQEGCQTRLELQRKTKERERETGGDAGWRALSSVWEQQGPFQSNSRFKRLSWQKGE